MIGLGLLAMKWNLLISKTIFELVDLIQLLKQNLQVTVMAHEPLVHPPFFSLRSYFSTIFIKQKLNIKVCGSRYLHISNVKSMFNDDFFVYNCQINSRYQWDLNEKLKMAASERQKIENNIVLFCVVTLWEKMTWRNGRKSRKHRLGSR